MTAASGTLHRLLRLRTVVPVLLAASLLAIAFSLSDSSEVLSRLLAIPLLAWVCVVVLAGAYLLLKGLQFVGLLRDLGLSPKVRHLLLSYAVGELTLTLPFGVYAQNYLLQRLHGSGLLRSVAVTTQMLILETGTMFLLVAVIGIPGWDWLRPVAWLCLGGLIVTLRAVSHPSVGRWLSGRFSGRLHSVGSALAAVLSITGRVGNVGILWRRGYLTVLYLLVLIVAFYILGHAVGVQRLTLQQAGGVYAFSLSIALVFGGVVSQVGTVEIAGMGAAQAFGYSFTESLAMLLGFRIVWTMSIWLILVPAVFALRRDLVEAGADDGQETTD